MDLVLQHDSPFNTTITQQDGTNLYQFQTKQEIFHEADTLILKFERNSAHDQASWQPIANIKRSALNSGDVYLRSSILPAKIHIIPHL